MLSILLGALAGFSMGLTGGGGAIFAVPLLVYGLSVAPRDAVGISLVAVGATAAIGCLQRARRGQVELRTGLIFAVAGMLGAPLGSLLAGRIPETILLLLFATLMIVIAARMWRKASEPSAPGDAGDDEDRGPTCRRDAAGVLRLTSRCALLLSAVGLSTGVLSGLFGVGGGFIIVPALMTFSGMGMQRAIGTSMLVMTLISITGVTSHLFAGRSVPIDLAALFIVGGVLGLFAGTALGRRLTGPRLQQVFAVVILAVAMFVIVRNLV